ncbi:MAG: adenylosuccinate synthetase, partial [Candidatus Omnitrophica bacterium]|nr:adenylosuccinate synthetase [Candidatus Omnitrophota bacterium]
PVGVNLFVASTHTYILFFTNKGKVYKDFPTDIRILENCTPVYEICDGWREDTSAVESFRTLPREARRYINRLEKLLGIKVSMISIGSERKQVIRK